MRPPENVARLAELQQAAASGARSAEEVIGDLQSLEEPIDLARVQSHLQELAAARVEADALSAAVSRESALQALKGKVQTPAKLIDAALALQAPGEIERGRSGQAVEPSGPEPWPEAVEKPWGEWRRGKPLSGVQLARLLKPFGIRPKQVRVGGHSKKGYDLGDFEDAFSRYLPSEPKHRNNPDEIRVFGGFRVETESGNVSGQQELQVAEEKRLSENVSGVSGRNRDLAVQTGVSTRNPRPATERQPKDWIEV